MLLKVFSLSILCALKPSRVRIQSCHCKWETNKVANTDPYTIPANTEGRGVIGCWANQITAFQLLNFSPETVPLIIIVSFMFWWIQSVMSENTSVLCVRKHSRL